MYDLVKISDVLQVKGYGDKGTTLWLGRFDMENLQNGIMLSQDVTVGDANITFSEVSGYDKTIVKLTYLGNSNYTSSSQKVNEIYDYFVKNTRIIDADIIQVIPEVPVLIDKVKNKYLWVMLLNIAYKR